MVHSKHVLPPGLRFMEGAACGRRKQPRDVALVPGIGVKVHASPSSPVLCDTARTTLNLQCLSLPIYEMEQRTCPLYGSQRLLWENEAMD